MKGKKIIIGLLGLMVMSQVASAATTVDAGSFNNFYDAVVSWIQGSLGLTIALLGMLGTVIVYAFTHKGSTIFIGMLISFFVGGIVSISNTMFHIGMDAFTTT